MKLSYGALCAWFVDSQHSPAKIAEILTLSGLEVDGLHPVAPAFEGVVVGEVLACHPHPNANKLSLCQVTIGQSAPLSIICGAPNVRTGLKVAVATIGARLPSGMAIKRVKLRGEPSEGMLCSCEELGLAKDKDGIFELPADAPVGQDLRSYLSLDDMLLEIDLTPNRGDCLSVRGIARELSALTGDPWQDHLAAYHDDPMAGQQIPPSTEAPVIQAEDACPIYLTQRFVLSSREMPASPAWLRQWLTRHDQRAIDWVVDLTNYVMLQTGQPMHAFDADTLVGQLVVRYARVGESLVLLDGKTVDLQTNTLVIADQEKVLAIAGVMGGDASAVKPHTRRLVVESALFDRGALGGIARQYGLHTESAYRFERGVDPALPAKALAYLRHHLLADDRVSAEVLTQYRSDAVSARPTEISLFPERVNQRLGTDFPAELMTDYLQRLGCTVNPVAEHLKVQAPSHRYDLAIAEDLSEEIARVYGYNHLPSQPMTFVMHSQSQVHPLSEVKQQFCALGYLEAINYSFIDAADQILFYGEDSAPCELINPIVDYQSQMRQGLLAGLLRNIAYNSDRQQSAGRLFEVGRVFVGQDQGLQQPIMVSGVAFGDHHSKQWYGDRRAVDYFDVKGDLEALFERLTLPVTFAADKVKGLHPGKCAIIKHQGQQVGVIGNVHPQVLATLGISVPVVAFELDAACLLQPRQMPGYQRLSKYPEVRRDLALIVDDSMDYATVKHIVVKEIDKKWLEDIQLFDLYQGDAIGKGKKSIGLSFVFRAQDQTLSDEDVNAVMGAIIEKLDGTYHISLRE